DAELLARWHADPEVARFWDGETFTADEIRDRLARSDVNHHVVEAGGGPGGYLPAWRGGDAPGARMFLVPAGARPRVGARPGTGAPAGRVAADGGPRLTVDPYVWNERAVRAWQRAGFEPVEERPADDEHTDRWLLMEFRDRGAAHDG